MMITNNASERARWSIRWPHKGRIVRKDFGTDFMGAMSLLHKALAAGRKATMVCNNMGFPPPERYQPHEVRGYRTINGRRKFIEAMYTPMRKLNNDGVWWCPYCIKFRRFELNKAFEVDGIAVPETFYSCPICGIHHTDHHVRRWNPVAVKMFYNPPGERRVKRRRLSGGRPINTKRRRR